MNRLLFFFVTLGLAMSYRLGCVKLVDRTPASVSSNLFDGIICQVFTVFEGYHRSTSRQLYYLEIFSSIKLWGAVSANLVDNSG